MLRTRFRRLPAACLLFFLLFVRTASGANRWGESNWGDLLWGGGAAVPALGARELVVLAALFLSTGILLTRRLLKRRTGEER